MDMEKPRNTPIDLSRSEFQKLGHALVDQIAEFFDTLPNRPLTAGKNPTQIRELIGTGPLPENGQSPQEFLGRTAEILFDNSLFNAHPLFLGYITSPAAPLGALGDFLAAAVNPNCGAWPLAPVATEIERQSIRWLADLIGYDTACGGILVSGGNMANFVGFLVGRRVKAGWDIATHGMRHPEAKTLRVYVSAETHTWVQKAADMFGLGTDAVRWVPVADDLKMDITALRARIESDIAAGDRPFLVVGTAGSVSTGVIDPLLEIAALCREFDLWFHADGAYGAFAAAAPDVTPAELREGLALADSIALDPHKWLYSPLEVGGVLVKDAEAMRQTFSYHPDYYEFDGIGGESALSFVDYGPQNSRGFRALKVWLGLKQVGRSGCERMIADDIALARRLYDLAEARSDFEARTMNLSIATFRYVPEGLDASRRGAETYLNELNAEVLTRLQAGGEAFVSNAVLDGTYLLRACVVNFRTTTVDIDRLPDIIARVGREVDGELRPEGLR